MSENLDLVRSIYADWERGDFSSAEWAHPEMDYVLPDGPHPGRWRGLSAARGTLRLQLASWQQLRPEVQECRELDSERVLVLMALRGVGKTSGLETPGRSAVLFHIQAAKVTRLVVYADRERALTDLGLKE
jgi:ketosteroid isomerase-like protein